MPDIVRTKHKDIADYWWHKSINRRGEIFSSLVEDSLPLYTEKGGCECWACGHSAKDYDELERCHIIPNSLGGEDKPRNLILLCPKCHEESPDTVNAGAFLRWVFNRKCKYINGRMHPVRFLEAVDEEIKQRGHGSLEQILKKVSDPSVSAEELHEGLVKYLDGHITSH